MYLVGQRHDEVRRQMVCGLALAALGAALAVAAVAAAAAALRCGLTTEEQLVKVVEDDGEGSLVLKNEGFEYQCD